MHEDDFLEELYEDRNGSAYDDERDYEEEAYNQELLDNPEE